MAQAETIDFHMGEGLKKGIMAQAETINFHMGEGPKKGIMAQAETINFHMGKGLEKDMEKALGISHKATDEGKDIGALQEKPPKKDGRSSLYPWLPCPPFLVQIQHMNLLCLCPLSQTI